MSSVLAVASDGIDSWAVLDIAALPSAPTFGICREDSAPAPFDT
jgi:hypothetical protein